MSSNSSDSSIARLRAYRQPAARLVRYIRSVRPAELSIERIYEVAGPTSQLAFAEMLQHLVKLGLLRKVVRVESPGRGGIGDYPSLEDVPRVIHDWKTGLDVEVAPDDIHLVYKLDKNKIAHGAAR